MSDFQFTLTEVSLAVLELQRWEDDGGPVVQAQPVLYTDGFDMSPWLSMPAS